MRLLPKKVNEAVRSWNGLRATRALHLLLAPHGLAWLVARIHARYGDEAHLVVRERPYELTSVFGVGFQIADRIARAADVPADSPGRARAALLHVLAEAERDGSTCLPLERARSQAGELLGTDPPDRDLLEEMVERGELTLEVDDDGADWAYRAETAALEAELAERVTELADSGRRRGWRRPSSRRTAPLTPAPEQWSGVLGAFAAPALGRHRRPGHRQDGEHPPDLRGGGRAATPTCCWSRPPDAPRGGWPRRPTIAASTIHAALAWVPGEGPGHDEDHPLQGDLLVVDESSMANLDLLVTLLRAVGPRMHVVLVGDADQLAPVGAGKPFAELVASGRRAGRPAAAHLPPGGGEHDRPGRARDPPRRGARRDRAARACGATCSCSSAPTRDRPWTRSSGSSPGACPPTTGVDAVADIQVFAPVYRGALGIDALNARLRDALNPAGEPVLHGRLRVGDKLMLAGRNLHDLGLMNGTRAAAARRRRRRRRR